MSPNKQPLNNKEIQRFPISPLLQNQPSVHYLLVRANVRIKSEVSEFSKVTLLVDTGASYTTLPVEVLNDLGYDTKNTSKWHPGIVTGQGQTSRIPIVQLSAFYCLKKQMINFPVLAYTLPTPKTSNNFLGWDGVLGMDFLIHFRAVILLENKGTSQLDQIVLR